LDLQINWQGMLVLEVSMNHASVMALPNISCGLERTLLRYEGTFSPQLHAFGYEGRAGMRDSLYLSFAKWNCIMLHIKLTSEWHP